jgi:hypothetical protein
MGPRNTKHSLNYKLYKKKIKKNAHPGKRNLKLREGTVRRGTVNISFVQEESTEARVNHIQLIS